MPDYQKGKIYRIINIENETVYIGSTCQALSQRLATHRHRGNGNKIVLVKECPCENNEQLRREEQLCIEGHEGLLNKLRAYQTEEQKKEQHREGVRKYDEANREKRIEYTRKYKELNREKVIESRRKYNEANRDKIREQQLEKITCEHCGSIVSRVNIARHQGSKKCMKARESTAEP
jgi:protein-arginine kinase activator protein McsA